MKKETIYLKKSKILTAINTETEEEIHIGKSATKGTQYLTVSQQINNMLNPEGMGTEILTETTIPATEKDENDIDLYGARVNKYKPSKHDAAIIGREADEKLQQEGKIEK